MKIDVKTEANLILLTQGQLGAAQYLAQTLFSGKPDKGGQPYFGHLERVANGIHSGNNPCRNAIQAIAYMHDLIEDIDGWTCEDLADIGFDAFIIEGVRAVTKSGEGAPYFDEMVRLGRTPQAIPVKKSDLRDNSNLLRLPHLPTDEDIARVRKYYLSHCYLSDVESGHTAPGTPFASWMKFQPAARQDWGLLRQHSAHPYCPLPFPKPSASGP